MAGSSFDLSSCRATSPCTTASTESPSLCDWTSPGAHVVIGGTFRHVAGRCRTRRHQRSLLLCHVMSGLDVICRVFRRYRKTSPGDRRGARYHRRSSSLTSCCGTSPCATSSTEPLRCVSLGHGTSPGVTSSAESIVVLQDVAGLRVSYRVAGSRQVQRHRWGLFVLSDVTALDVIDGAFYRAAGRRRV